MITPVLGQALSFCSTHSQNFDGEHFSMSGGDVHPGAVGSAAQFGMQPSGGCGSVHPLGSGLHPVGVHWTLPSASFEALRAQYSFVASHVAVPHLFCELPLEAPLDVPVEPAVEGLGGSELLGALESLLSLLHATIRRPAKSAANDEDLERRGLEAPIEQLCARECAIDVPVIFFALTETPRRQSKSRLLASRAYAMPTRSQI